MPNWNGFRGAAKRIDDADLPRIGAMIGVGEDELHAFMDVESAGSGFDRQGRPTMLFEPHVFYRNLSGDLRARAVAMGLAYPKWKPGAYPADSYPRLLKAVEIDERAALLAASWGSTQVLGENYKECGYSTPQALVRAFMDDEENHLLGTVKFIIATGIADDLRAHRWAKVARVYNGAGYSKNHYDTKMASAFAKWKRIKDTLPAPPDLEPIHLPAPPAGPPAKNVGPIAGGAAAAGGVAVAASQGLPWWLIVGVLAVAAVGFGVYWFKFRK